MPEPIVGGLSRIPIEVDKTHRLLTRSVDLQRPHDMVHQGRHFYTFKTVSLTNGQISTLGMTVGNKGDKRINLFMEFDVSAACTVDVLEDCDAFTGGVASSIFNNDRESLNQSMATVITGHTGADPITVGSGNEIYSQALGSGNRSGGTLGHDAEMLLKRNSLYLFRITNGVTKQGTSIVLQWYETETQKEI